MSIANNPSIVTSGLRMYLDAANPKSYNPAENLLQYSQTFTTVWTASTATITANTTTAPDGTLTASTMTEDTTTNQHLITQSLGTVVLGSIYTFSIYAKAGTRTQISLTSYGEGYSAFNLSTGAVIQTGGNTCSITDVGNGWYRISATITKTNTNGAFYIIMWNNTNNYLGTGAYEYIWGAQINVGTYVRNYTVTTSASITASTTWTDLTGNGYNATLANTYFAPAVAAGVFETLGVSGSNIVQTTLNYSSTNYTMITATRYSGASRGRMLNGYSNNWLVGQWGSTTENYYAEGWVSAVSAGTNDTTWRLYAATGDISGDSYSEYVNGTLSVSNNGGSQGPNGFMIGAYGQLSTNELSTGQCGFVMAYNRVLTANEVSQNFQALRGRYGI